MVTLLQLVVMVEIPPILSRMLEILTQLEQVEVVVDNQEMVAAEVDQVVM